MGLRDRCSYVAVCTDIIAEIPCSIAHLEAHSADLGLQMHKTCMHTLALHGSVLLQSV